MTWRLSRIPLPNLFSLAILALLAVAYFAPFGDLDFGILIRLGQRIVETGDLRPSEGFSYTIAGTDVPDHEWLFEVLVWWLWAAFGYGGIKLLKVLLVGATLLVTGLRLRSGGVRWHGIALALGLAVMLLAPGWNLRPLYVTTLGLLLLSWWLHDHCTGRRTVTWWLPVLMLLWANMHPGVIIGQGLLLGAIAWEWLNRRLRWNPPLDWEGCWRLTVIGGVGLAATFVSPDPIGRFLCPFQPEVRHPIMHIFQEMRPLYETAVRPPYSQLLVYPLAALVIVTMILCFRCYRLWEIALLTGLAWLANTASRSTQDWVLVMLCLGVPHLAALLGHGARQDRRRAPIAALLRLDRRWKCLLQSRLFRFQWLWPAAALLLLAIISLWPGLGHNMPLRDRRQDPGAAAAWLEKERCTGDRPLRIFAPPDYGAYLVWRLGDRVRCYVDTRGFCFPSELMEDSHYLPQMTPGWQERLDKVIHRHTDYFLLETTGPRGRLWQELQQLGVEPLYRDEQAVILTAKQLRQALPYLDGTIARKKR
jgi:hypothetical protein